jgi:3-hydroxyacyl-CoA dehydrogenase / enoyl-CoA hydratase / 3-hydroxybutyryl-CoA epimerase
MSVINYHKDENKIVHLILDKPDASANLMDAEFAQSFAEIIQRLLQDDYHGVILRSAKSTFFAGGDLTMLSKVKHENSQSLFNMTESIKASMRQLETQTKPVVACIAGAALGGGWETALACHYRVVVDNPKIKLGLPEVTLGLLPGAGGITRMVRLLGLQNAMPFLAEGRLFNPARAKSLGLVNELVRNESELIDAATKIIQDKQLAKQTIQQIWDIKGYKIPGGNPSQPKVAQLIAAAPSMIRQNSKGVYPAPESIFSVMVEGAQVDFDTATRIETRYFVELARGKISKNMINTLWFQLNEIKALVARPKNIPQQEFKKVGILGAGMMGAGIAYACAVRGISVVLKDVYLENAVKGKNYSENLLQKKMAKGRVTTEEAEAILNLITVSEQAEDLSDCELVIEAVFENREIKANVTQEAEAHIQQSTIFATNTSTLPITGLAKASSRAKQFIGLHFFSPVDKMPLVEIICGEKTNDETLAHCYDFVLQIGKTPIVVNDSRGFFTSRVFSTFVKEGIAMLAEGIQAASIENAAFLSGFPVGPLAISDEVSLSLMAKIKQQTIDDLALQGESYLFHPADPIIDQMLQLERVGKSSGVGFYDYPAQSQKHLWSGLEKHFGVENIKLEVATNLQDMKDRLLFIMAIESVRCLQENVLTSVRDANVGSIMGIGYPAWTGGVLQFINQFGLPQFIKRANELVDKHGVRFSPPQLLIDKAENGERFE